MRGINFIFRLLLLWFCPSPDGHSRSHLLQCTLVAVLANLHSHGNIGIRYIGRRCRSLPPAIHPLTLDNGREILIADIQIHIAVDTCNLALLKMLPDAVSTAVVGLVHPVRQPDRVPRLDIIGSMCGQRRSRAVQPDKVTRALNLFKERTHDIITTPLRIMRKFIFLQNQDNTQVYFERTTV